MRCYLGAVKWKKGVIVDQTSPLCYYVEVDGRRWKRHIDQLKSGTVGTDIDSPVRFDIDSDVRVPPHSGHLPYVAPSRQSNAAPQPVRSPQVEGLPLHVEPQPSTTCPETVSNPHPYTPVTISPGPRRSNRVRNAPKRLDL